jgi:hypothetical protein
MNNKLVLNRIEHNLLSMQMDDSEPLFILYADTKRDIEGVTLNDVIQSLMRLVDLGFSECIVHEDGKWNLYKNITTTKLHKRFKGQSEEERIKYPMHTDEYYFRITPKGRIEEEKEAYNQYYSE